MFGSADGIAYGPVLFRSPRPSGTTPNDIRASWWVVVLLPLLFAAATAAFGYLANQGIEALRFENAVRVELCKERLFRAREQTPRPEAAC